MLETFRKYTGLMFVILILLFVGLVFFGSSQQSLFSGPKVVTAHGRGFTEVDVRRMAERPASMLRDMANPGGGAFSPRYQHIDPYLRRMGVMTYAGFELNREQLNAYLVNRVSLQQAMQEFGVAASTAEIELFLKTNIFVEDGEFSEDAYREFSEKTLEPLGMRVKEMNEIIGEIIALGKLEEILGSGVDASRDVVQATYLAGSQRVSYQLASFPLTQFEKDENPTEEDVKKHWEERKAEYLSKPKRRITYILARPDYAALEKELNAKEEDEEEGEKEGEEEAKTDEEKDSPSDTALTPEQRRRAVRDLGAKFDELDTRLGDSNGEGLEEIVKELEFGFELKTTELAEKEDFPAELAIGLRDEPEMTGADLIFEHILGETLFDSFGEIKRIGSDQWLLFRVDEVVEPKELTYEDAREEARLDVIKQRAAEAMTKAAEEHHKAIAEALKGGKTFAQAAEDRGLIKPAPMTEADHSAIQKAIKEGKSFAEAAEAAGFKMSETLTKAAEKIHTDIQKALDEGKEFVEAADEFGPLQSNISEQKDVPRPVTRGPSAAGTEFNLCTKTNPGELSEVLTEDNAELGIRRAIFVYVESREVYEDPNLASTMDARMDAIEQRNRGMVLDNWLSQRAAQADMKVLTGGP